MRAASATPARMKLVTLLFIVLLPGPGSRPNPRRPRRYGAGIAKAAGIRPRAALRRRRASGEA